jgi:hypothetical protein
MSMPTGSPGSQMATTVAARKLAVMIAIGSSSPSFEAMSRV